MTHADLLRSLLKQGRSLDDALGELRRAGASAIDCIKAIIDVENAGLSEARHLFAVSPSLADIQRLHDELCLQRQRLASEIASAVTIYVRLLDEGTAVWRSVAAARVGEGTYLILSANSEHSDEVWEFDKGDLVRCADKVLSGGDCNVNVKVAAARVSSEAG